MGKKAQMKIQQTSLMLMAITILFVLVGLFFISFKVGQSRGQVNSLQEKNAIILASKLSENPELACGEVFGTKRVNCIDGDKLIALMARSERYSNFWGISNVEVLKIFSPDEEVVECTPLNYPNCNDFWLFNSTRRGFSSSSFVVICHKENENRGYFEDKCDLARLIIYREKL